MQAVVIFFLYLVSFVQSEKAVHIVDGVDVNPPGKWPWQGSFEVLGDHNCGAVLVSENYALTAAHCLYDAIDMEGYNLIFGAHDRVTGNEGRPEDYALESWRRHPGFVNDGSLGFPNDLGIIKLARPANFSNDFIDMLPLDTGDTNRVGDDCYISGWGRTCGSCSLSDILQEANIGVISVENCSAIWNAITSVEVKDFHICVYDDPDFDSGACNGDSGGPLVCQADGVDNWELCGITSWGLSGCGTTAPSVYTRVAYYREWLCLWTEGEVGC